MTGGDCSTCAALIQDVSRLRTNEASLLRTVETQLRTVGRLTSERDSARTALHHTRRTLEILVDAIGPQLDEPEREYLRAVVESAKLVAAAAALESP